MTLVAKVTMKPNWDSTKGLERGVAEMATDIHKRASILAPKKDRHLVNSGVIKRLGVGTYMIRFGSSVAPYARIHELGGDTGRNYATKIVAKHYLGRAADGVERGNTVRYFKDKVS